MKIGHVTLYLRKSIETLAYPLLYERNMKFIIKGKFIFPVEHLIFGGNNLGI